MTASEGNQFLLNGCVSLSHLENRNPQPVFIPPLMGKTWPGLAHLSFCGCRVFGNPHFSQGNQRLVDNQIRCAFKASEKMFCPVWRRIRARIQGVASRAYWNIRG
jgi:hypothetical protein